MANVKEAVTAALSSAKEWFPNALDIRLEEIEIPQGSSEWLITLSFLVPKAEPVANVFAQNLFPQHERLYKIFIVDIETGHLKSMRIRPT